MCLGAKPEPRLDHLLSAEPDSPHIAGPVDRWPRCGDCGSPRA